MPVRLRGGTIAADAEVEDLFKALRVAHRPIDYGAGGSFQITSKGGTMVAGLGVGPIYAFRNALPGMLCAIRRVRVSAWSLGTGFTAGLGTLEMKVARSWTAPDTGGATDTITTNNGKMRTNMAAIAALAEIRHSTTGLLSAGTRTLDAQPLESFNVNVGTGANTAFITSRTLLFERATSEHPLLLATNEGFVIEATVPATGTWSFAITPEWEELTSY
jgi:hypothetical protein